MTLSESKRRARARRWLRGYIRAVEGDKDDPGHARPGWERWCKRNGIDDPPFGPECSTTVTIVIQKEEA